ncbi:hypothetical protein ACLB2K_003199 [Fragaria x ananassa]
MAAQGSLLAAIVESWRALGRSKQPLACKGSTLVGHVVPLAALGRSKRPLGVPRRVKLALGGPRRVKACKGTPVAALSGSCPPPLAALGGPGKAEKGQSSPRRVKEA